MTIKAALAEGTRQLKSPSPTALALIDTPALDAALLLAKALDTSREQLIIRGYELMGSCEYQKFSDLLTRRSSGECIAYILGRKEFRLLEFAVNPHVLVPRPDTETLVEAALEHIDYAIEREKHGISLLDLCTGSGAVAISLKHERPYIKVTASDISKQALKIAALNSGQLLNGAETNLIESDLFENIHDKFNIIVSNPPYIPSSEFSSLAPELRREPKLALDGGKDGLKYISKIIPQAKDHLFPNGILLLEADSKQMPTVQTLLENNNYSGIKIYRDLSGQKRVISGNR